MVPPLTSENAKLPGRFIHHSDRVGETVEVGRRQKGISGGGKFQGAAEETKARYAFVYGDFRRVHRSGLIACVYRAAEWRHKDVELAAHDLLQLLDSTSA